MTMCFVLPPSSQFRRKKHRRPGSQRKDGDRPVAEGQANCTGKPPTGPRRQPIPRRVTEKSFRSQSTGLVLRLAFETNQVGEDDRAAETRRQSPDREFALRETCLQKSGPCGVNAWNKRDSAAIGDAMAVQV
jgi:hypothetical protein